MDCDCQDVVTSAMYYIISFEQLFVKRFLHTVKHWALGYPEFVYDLLFFVVESMRANSVQPASSFQWTLKGMDRENCWSDEMVSLMVLRWTVQRSSRYLYWRGRQFEKSLFLFCTRHHTLPLFSTLDNLPIYRECVESLAEGLKKFVLYVFSSQRSKC